MTTNVGGVDRAARAILGVALIAVGFYYKSWWGVIGLIPLVTAMIGVCPAYLPFKISTAKKQNA